MRKHHEISNDQKIFPFIEMDEGATGESCE
jgi:hypothetical protein